MITLITGQPGAGKTLHTLWKVKALAEKEGRDVFYNGITDLKLPWAELVDATKWHELPTGAIIVLDECQRTFRTRSNGSTVPEHVSQLETHRHKGYDIFLITQHPMIIDGNVRRLVGTHIHVMRRFGGSSAVVHEWNGVKEQCDKNRKDSQSKTWNYPKEVYDYYKSAELHTHKRKIPNAVIFLILVPFILGVLVYFLYGFTNSKMSSDKSQNGSSVAAMPAGFTSSTEKSKKMTKEEWLAAQVARIDGLPQTAPVYDDLARPQQVPSPQACVVMGDKCKCYTNQSTPISMPDDLCRNIVSNGIYLPHLPPSGAVTNEQQNLQMQYQQQQG